MTRILIAEEKHSTRHFDASTDELWAGACIALLKERIENGYIYRQEMPEERQYFYTDEMRDAVEMPREQVETLPDSLRQRIVMLRKQYVDAKRRAEHDNADYDEIKRIVDEHDTSMVTLGKPGRQQRVEPVAWQFLNKRSDYEYERVELEDLEVAT